MWSSRGILLGLPAAPRVLGFLDMSVNDTRFNLGNLDTGPSRAFNESSGRAFFAGGSDVGKFVHEAMAADRLVVSVAYCCTFFRTFHILH